MRWLKRFASFCILVMTVIGLGVIVPRPFFLGKDAEVRSRPIFLLSNPIHTDIAVPLDDALRAEFAFLARDGLSLDAPGAAWLVFGWGGRAFYLETPSWVELKLVPALKGLTVDQSAMHIALAGDIQSSDAAMRLLLTDEGYRHLLDYIRASFAEDPSGNPVAIPESGYGDFDTFYEAKGKFTALLGCNTWTAGALRTAGLQTGFWTPLPAFLQRSLRLYGAPTGQ